MRDSALRLQDKTMLIVGPFNGVTQACLRSLTEFGCDVGLVSHDSAHATRYAEGLNEAREVHPNYGRAVHYNLPTSTAGEIDEALGQITRSIGRIDALIDASPLSWDSSSEATTAVGLSTTLAEKCLPFLLAKQRGRIVYLFQDVCLEPMLPSSKITELRQALIEKIQSLAIDHLGKNITVNGVSIGITDDFLLKLAPQSQSLKKTFEALQGDYPKARLVEFHDVSLGVAYLASNLSASLTGQILRLTQGQHLNSAIN